MNKPSGSRSDCSSFTDEQSFSKSTSFSQLSGSTSGSSSLQAAIYRVPGSKIPFRFEGGKTVRFMKKSSKRFETFLDACNYGAENGFVINTDVEDWFALIEDAEQECAKKKLLATLTRPNAIDVSEDFILLSNSF